MTNLSSNPILIDKFWESIPPAWRKNSQPDPNYCSGKIPYDRGAIPGFEANPQG